MKNKIEYKSEVDDVYLINPPIRAYSIRMPLGLMYISSYLDSKGINNKILDFKTKNEDEALQKILTELKEKKPRIIGVSCLCTEIVYVKCMCQKIKELLPDSKIIVGGAHPTNYPHLFTKEKYIDFVVIGEGEITFYELCKLLLKSKNPTKKELLRVKGIAWKDNFSKPRSFIENLDELPTPAYDKIDMKFYTKPTSWKIRPVFASVASIFTARGCPFRCRYCVASAVFGKKVRGRSPKLVVDEVELLLKKYLFDAIYFFDDTFTLNKKRVIGICNEIIKRKLRFVWGCQTRVHLVSEDLLKVMKEAGCIQLDFGIESCSQKLLNLIQKDITYENIVKALRLCKKVGIRSFVNLMTNLPTETEEDLQMTIDCMKKEKPNVMIWNVTIPYPGTNLNGVVVEDEDLEILNRFPSKKAYQLLEKKYKLAHYDYDIQDLVYNNLYKTFFHPRKVYLNLKSSYIASFIRFIDFIFNPRYISMVLRSKRKGQYLKEIFKINPNKGEVKILMSKTETKLKKIKRGVEFLLQKRGD